MRYFAAAISTDALLNRASSADVCFAAPSSTGALLSRASSIDVCFAAPSSTGCVLCRAVSDDRCHLPPPHPETSHAVRVSGRGELRGPPPRRPWSAAGESGGRGTG